MRRAFSVGGAACSNTAVKAWCSFMHHQGERDIQSEDHVIEFVIWIHTVRKVKLSTVRRYLTGLSQAMKLTGVNWARKRFTRLDITLRGLAKVYPQASGTSRGKNPISIGQLRLLADATTPTDVVYRALYLCVFWSASRMGEFAPPRRDLVLTSLSKDQVTFIPEGATVRLAYSKTDVTGVGVDVFIPRLPQTKLCPVRALEDMFRMYTWYKRAGEQPLFERPVGSGQWQQVVYEDASARLKQRLGGDPKLGTHSLRKGAATLAGRCGVPDRLIQLWGRWRSDCFKLYTVVTHGELRQHILRVFQEEVLPVAGESQ